MVRMCTGNAQHAHRLSFYYRLDFYGLVDVEIDVEIDVSGLHDVIERYKYEGVHKRVCEGTSRPVHEMHNILSFLKTILAVLKTLAETLPKT
jgi:hypothetical protein